MVLAFLDLFYKNNVNKLIFVKELLFTTIINYRKFLNYWRKFATASR